MVRINNCGTVLDEVQYFKSPLDNGILRQKQAKNKQSKIDSRLLFPGLPGVPSPTIPKAQPTVLNAQVIGDRRDREFCFFFKVMNVYFLSDFHVYLYILTTSIIYLKRFTLKYR